MSPYVTKVDRTNRGLDETDGGRTPTTAPVQLVSLKNSHLKMFVLCYLLPLQPDEHTGRENSTSKIALISSHTHICKGKAQTMRNN